MAGTGTTAEVDLAEVYRDRHAHPELSFPGNPDRGDRGRAAARAFGYETTTGIGGTGVVGVLRHGAGATALLRADMDALPVLEETGLPYASTAARRGRRRARRAGDARLRSRHARELLARRGARARRRPGQLVGAC